MKKGLKNFLTSIIIVLLMVVAIDFVVGRTIHWMLPQISNQGDTGKTYFSLNDVNAPIVIVGSSRAAHHYVTQMVEDSFCMSAYNVGRDGCFFSYNCCVINSILDRYIPKLIIWENGVDYLFEEEKDPLENLYPYYNCNKWVKQTITEELPWTEYIRLTSNLYQYNSVIHRIVSRYMGRDNFIDETINGYFPLKPKKLNSPLVLETRNARYQQLSETKIERFRSVLARAKEKGVRIVVVDSPKYTLKDGKNYSKEKMQQLCDEYGAMFIDNTQLSLFFEHAEYFNDLTHLNDEGAKVYTAFFLKQLSGKE